MIVATNALMRELFYDYGAGKVSSDLKADIDTFLARYPHKEHRILKLFAYGVKSTELAVHTNTPVTTVDELIVSALASLSVFLEIDDTKLYQRIKPTKHAQLAQFLTQYTKALHMDLEEILYDFRNAITISTQAA